MIPTISHPTGKPNFSVVNVDSDTYWFSYSTCIAFQKGWGTITVCENDWGPTTGKHLNWVNEDKSKRLPREEFLAALNQGEK